MFDIDSGCTVKCEGQLFVRLWGHLTLHTWNLEYHINISVITSWLGTKLYNLKRLILQDWNNNTPDHSYHYTAWLWGSPVCPGLLVILLVTEIVSTLHWTVTLCHRLAVAIISSHCRAGQLMRKPAVASSVSSGDCQTVLESTSLNPLDRPPYILLLTTIIIQSSIN